MYEADPIILRCPVSGESLTRVTVEDIAGIIGKDFELNMPEGEIDGGYINASGRYLYPVMEGIILLLPHYAWFTGDGEDIRSGMVFDKKRVFNYYNDISYKLKEGMTIYEDTGKWVDYREVSSAYIFHCFSRARQYLNAEGKYFLDIASGPIGLKEYLTLSDGYEIRICIDISVNALIQAKHNLNGRKGIFICGDITNIPLQEGICDAVLSQHTLYHIPKNEQHKAVGELYRVARPGTSVAIVYNWFFYSLLMDISLFPIQIYRLLRHYAGKVWVRLFSSKPRLYFYVHPRSWFRKRFPFSGEISFYCWRSTNKYFMNIYIHKRLFGESILRKLRDLEEKYPRWFGKHGAYPVIVIRKKKSE